MRRRDFLAGLAVAFGVVALPAMAAINPLDTSTVWDGAFDQQVYDAVEERLIAARKFAAEWEPPNCRLRARVPDDVMESLYRAAGVPSPAERGVTGLFIEHIQVQVEANPPTRWNDLGFFVSVEVYRDNKHVGYWGYPVKIPHPTRKWQKVTCLRPIGSV